MSAPERNSAGHTRDPPARLSPPRFSVPPPRPAGELVVVGSSAATGAAARPARGTDARGSGTSSEPTSMTKSDTTRKAPMRSVPGKMFLTRGVGIHREKLTSFEMALREAGTALFNLFRVSSISPPQCQIIPRDDGLQILQPGEIVFVVLAEMATNEAGRG